MLTSLAKRIICYQKATTNLSSLIQYNRILITHQWYNLLLLSVFEYATLFAYDSYLFSIFSTFFSEEFRRI